jgi:hypothetical protein
VAAGGVPHVLTQDDKYGDYVLPKGTILFANTWSIHRTCEYATPDEFMPERFLNNEYGIAAELTEEGKDSMRRPLYGFGAGRRACPGQRLAENSLVSPQASSRCRSRSSKPCQDCIQTREHPWLCQLIRVTQIINMAKLVWAFDISLQEYTMTDDSVLGGYEGGFLVCPKRFPLVLNPRSPEHVAIVDAEMEQVQPFLNTFKSWNLCSFP